MRHLTSFSKAILQIHYLHLFHQNGQFHTIPSKIAKMKSYIFIKKKKKRWNNRVKNWKKIERERERKTHSLDRA